MYSLLDNAPLPRKSKMVLMSTIYSLGLDIYNLMFYYISSNGIIERSSNVVSILSEHSYYHLFCIFLFGPNLKSIHKPWMLWERTVDAFHGPLKYNIIS